MVWIIIGAIALGFAVYFCYYFLFPFITFGVYLFRGHRDGLWHDARTKDGKLTILYTDPDTKEECTITAEYTLEPFRYMLPSMCDAIKAATNYIKYGSI